VTPEDVPRMWGALVTDQKPENAATKALVVRFDQELGYVHASDRLRCPRGVVHGTPTGWNGSAGTYREVLPCALSIGHDGACEAATRLQPEATVCGLPMHDSPWTLAPDSAERCPTCFDLDVPAHEQEALL